MSIVVTYRDQVLLDWNGGMDPRTQQKPTSNTVYRIGSVTKLFATLLLWIAHSSGKVDSNQPVTNYIPDLKLLDSFHKGDPALDNKYTWNQISSQLAGMPREAPCPGVLTCPFTNDQMLTKLRSTYLILPPGLYPSYSNLGFSLLGNLLAERIFGGTWETLVEEMITKPLGMTNTHSNGEAVVIPPVPKQDLLKLGWSHPAGGLYSTANDLSKLARWINSAFISPFLFGGKPWNVQTNPSTAANPTILSVPPNFIRSSLSPHYINPDASAFGSPWEMNIIGEKNATFYARHKAGNLNSYSSDISLIPELQLGVALTTNLNADGTAWTNNILSTMLPEFVHHLLTLQSAPPSPIEESWRYIGVYDYDTQIGINIRGQISTLRMLGQVKGLPMVSSPSNPSNHSLLQIYIPPSTLGCTINELLSYPYAFVQFHLDSTGRAQSFSIPGLYGDLIWNRIL